MTKVGRARIVFSFGFFFSVSVLLLFDTDGYAAASFFASILHEFGHIACLLLFSKTSFTLRFVAFGIRLSDLKTVFSPKEELLFLVSGSMLNFAASAVCFALATVLTSPQFTFFAMVNMFTGAINLLPIGFLDGSRIVGACLNRFFSPRTAAVIANVISVVFLLPIAVFSFIIVLQTKYNYSLLLLCMVLAASLFAERK